MTRGALPEAVPAPPGAGTPGLVALSKDDTRMPNQYERLNSAYVATGIQDRWLLSVGAEEVRIRRVPS